MSLPLLVRYEVEFASLPDAELLFFCENPDCVTVATHLLVTRPWVFFHADGAEQAARIANPFGKFDVRPFCAGCLHRERERREHCSGGLSRGHRTHSHPHAGGEAGQVHLRLSDSAESSGGESAEESSRSIRASVAARRDA